MPAELREPLVRFLDALEVAGAEHEEVYDTDVRERLGLPSTESGPADGSGLR
jgi:hypothetical protein